MSIRNERYRTTKHYIDLFLSNDISQDELPRLRRILESRLNCTILRDIRTMCFIEINGLYRLFDLYSLLEKRFEEDKKVYHGFHVKEEKNEIKK